MKLLETSAFDFEQVQVTHKLLTTIILTFEVNSVNLRFTQNSPTKCKFGHLSYEKPGNPSSLRCFDLQCCQTNNSKSFKINNR